MQSTLTSTETDPHDIFVIEPDVVLAARETELDPVQELLSDLAHKLANKTPPEVSVVAPTPRAVDTTFRAAAVDTIDTKDKKRVAGRPAGDRLVGEACLRRLHVRSLQRVRCRGLDPSWRSGETDDLKLVAAVRGGRIASDGGGGGGQACGSRAIGRIGRSSRDDG